MANTLSSSNVVRTAAAQSGEIAAPDFFIVGAPKCGTTSLHYYLQQHPGICMSNCSEPRYYCGEGRARTLEEYRKIYFPHYRMGQLVGEATPAYLRSETARDAIARDNPNAKIIVMARHHADALCSWWAHQSRFDRLPVSVDRIIDEEIRWRDSKGSIGESYGFFDIYTWQPKIEAYCCAFGRDHVTVISLSEMRQQPVATLNRICEFIGAPNFDWDTAELSVQNAAATVNLPRFNMVKRIKRLIRVVPFATNAPILWRYRAAKILDRLAMRSIERPSLSMELRRCVEIAFRSDATYLHKAWGLAEFDYGVTDLQDEC